jgi:hypothetical protein
MPPDKFGGMAELLAEIVVKHLEVDTSPRIGFRVWHLYPTGDRDESYDHMRALAAFRLDDGALQSLGDVSETAHRLVVERQKHMLRVAVVPFEQNIELPPSVVQAAKLKTHRVRSGEERDKYRTKAARYRRKRALLDKLKAERTIKSYPQFGVLLDLDAYIEDPPFPDDLSISDFVSNAVDDFAQVKPIVLSSAE